MSLLATTNSAADFLQPIVACMGGKGRRKKYSPIKDALSGIVVIEMVQERSLVT